MKQQKGITLIALIITIVVMLILVAVTLSIALGQNGVVTNAKDAAKGTNSSYSAENRVLGDQELGNKINNLVEDDAELTIDTTPTEEDQ